MDGVLLVDKPIGPSSFAVIRRLRKVSGIKKIGHAGTLDPLASGLLVVCFGRYTKLAGFLTDSDKAYEAEITLGITTTTDDAEGEVVAEKAVTASEEDVKKALFEFVGAIDQRPPNFSAIKVNGKRAYDLARAEQDVQLKTRRVTILELSLDAISLPRLTVKVHCSKGTYIRSLARDLGEKLGCGAYASQIRRIKSGEFLLTDALDLDKIEHREDILQNLGRGKQALKHVLEEVAISAFDREHIIHGRAFSEAVNFGGDTALATYEDEMVAILRKVAGKVSIARVI